ncbi:MAG: DUF2203 family protein [SAR324 cluster bacterium]|nr:DUF2203 family protein [SAR324 cluster bacterium]
MDSEQSGENRIFTYEEARAMIGEVRECTEEANESLEALRERLNRLPPNSSRAGKLNEWVNNLINQWAEEIMAMGAQPKGLWNVDFDSGEGYYFCWTLNEPDLTHFHLYEEGFVGRKPLSEIDGRPARSPALLD